MSFPLKINQYQTKSTVYVFFFLTLTVSLVLFKLDFCIPVCMTEWTRSALVVNACCLSLFAPHPAAKLACQVVLNLW